MNNENINPEKNFKTLFENTNPFYHTNLKNTLENIVLKNKIKKETSALERIFSDKTKTLKATVKALLDEIKLRENLNLHLLKKIDNDICSNNTQIMLLEKQKTHYVFDHFIEIKKQKIKLEDNVLKLENEKRKEYLECWRDLMFLKKYLLVALKEYWDMVNRRELLKSPQNC